MQHLQVHRFGCSIRAAHGQADLGCVSGKQPAFAETMEHRMRNFFVLVVVGILLAGGYVWVMEPSEQAAPRPQLSKDAIQPQADGLAKEGSAKPATPNEIAIRPSTNEQAGKSLQTITADSPVGQLGSDGARAHAEETPAGVAAETRGDHATIGLGHPERTVKSRSLATIAPSEADRLSHPEVGSSITNEPWTAGENGQELRKARRGSQGRRYIHRQYLAGQRFSELIKRPLELRCVACVMFNP